MKKIIISIFCSVLYLTNGMASEKSQFEIDVEKYKGLAHHKAMAIAMDDDGRYAYWYVHEQPFLKRAETIAMKQCNKAAKELSVKAKCKLYASGNKILLDF